MDMSIQPENRELALAPGVSAYMQDTTQGTIKTYVGPQTINQTGQERPVRYDPSQRRFSFCNLETAVSKNVFAVEGDYVVLENPTEQEGDGFGVFPSPGASAGTPALKQGTSINIPGPISFALWPGQDAEVVEGHNLRSNQYLVVRIYNEQAAKENWGQGVVKAAEIKAAETSGSDDETISVISQDVEELNLTMGALLVVKGTEVSFYIPPTGVQVLRDESGQYVRDALTLERLEYCILIDEDGNKRYERGPQVVFPEPTEKFFTENSQRKFKAEELNHIQGLHIKVIAPYNDDGSEVTEDHCDHKEGDEIFITGAECAIYYPRQEHSIIQYGDKKKHFATAVPVGEGRYVLNRKTGVVSTEKGPQMLLPNPIDEVIVRRILTDSQSNDWYPENDESLTYNRSLRTVSAQSETGYGDFVSDQDFLQSEKSIGAQVGITADSFRRGTKYTKPRTVTLDTKYECVPVIQPWTGYAVMVVDRSGNRRVEQGPTTILMNYDETLEVLELSTGKPKTTDKLQRTVYLRTKNNKVSDIIENVETKDHVPISIKLSFRVNFDGDANKWFEVENYVKLLCDHVRSIVKGSIRRLEIEEFYEEGTAILRDLILGKSVDGERPGLVFEENGMVVNDVEVLSIKIDDEHIAQMLDKAQHETVASNISVRQAEKQLKITKRQEEISREKAQSSHETALVLSNLTIERTKKELEVALTKVAAVLQEEQKNAEITTAKENTADITSTAHLARKKQAAEFEDSVAKSQLANKKDELAAETQATTARFGAAQEGFSEALLALKDASTLEKIASALSVQNVIGKNFAQVVQDLFKDSPLQPAMTKIAERAGVLSVGNSDQ